MHHNCDIIKNNSDAKDNQHKYVQRNFRLSQRRPQRRITHDSSHWTVVTLYLSCNISYIYESLHCAL